MLGRNVTIEIYGTLIDKKLYSGYITNERDLKRVYVISDNELHGTIDCVIIAATVSTAAIPSKLVAAPENEVFYEPEITQRLKRASVKFRKINCMYEKSCGAVIYRRNERNEIRILLVKNKNGKCWTFPKGHIEMGENEEQTALREIKEETGLSVEIVPGFRRISTYRPFGRIKKTAVFFLARAEKSTVNMQQSELDYYLWVSVDEALTLCHHENDMSILREVRRMLEK